MNKKLLYIVLFLLSVQIVLAATQDTTKNVIIGIDIVGVAIGVMLLVFMARTFNYFEGILKTSYLYFLYGISFQVIALVYTLIFVRFKLYPIPAGIDLHHLLMIAGILFFWVAIYKLRQMIVKLGQKQVK